MNYHQSFLSSTSQNDYLFRYVRKTDSVAYINAQFKDCRCYDLENLEVNVFDT